MSFYRWIVGHPVAVTMITLAAMVFGLVSYARLPLDLMPDISYPTLTVRTVYPGAAPEEVEAQVSRVLEEVLATVEGLVAIESRSRAGVSDVVLEFAWDTDMGEACQSVREQVQLVYFDDGPERPLLLRYDPSLDPILRIALSGSLSEVELRRLAEKEVKRGLETVDGVAAVTVRGGLERRVVVEPKEDWLEARGVTLTQLADTLAGENVNLAGGVVREGENEYLIRTLSELRSIGEIQALGIRRPDGQQVRLGDVATVRETTADREVSTRLNGESAVELRIFKEADANIVQVASRVKAALDAWSLPDGVEATVLDDQARFVEAALDNLVSDAVLGGVLCVLVTFAFLRDWRNTLLISTAIPICLVLTFAVMSVTGVSLNLMSLGGLALGVSMVVDSGTVVLENVQRHVDAGKSRSEAAILGTSEVATAVFASVLTGVAVFFPIVFVEGIAGQIFRDLAITVVFSLLTSLLVALVFIPMLAARELQLGDAPALGDVVAARFGDALVELRQKRRFYLWPYAVLRFGAHLFLVAVARIGGALSALFVRGVLGLSWVGLRFVDRISVGLADRFVIVYARFEAVFARTLLTSLRRPRWVLGSASLLLVASALLFSTLGAELLPEVHQGRFMVDAALPVGTPLEKTDAVLRQVEIEIAALPEVARVYSVVGSERGSDARADEGENTARLSVELTPGGDLAAREAALMEDIRDQVTGFAGLKLNFRLPALFSFHTPLEVVVFAQELPALSAAGGEVQRALGSVPGLSDVRSSLTSGYPEVQIHYDRDRIHRLGLSVGEVARSVRDKVQGREATRMAEGEERIDVVVRLAGEDRASVGEVGAINVNPRLQPPVRLDSVATLVESEGPSEIRRVDQRRAVVISANLAGFNLGAAADAARQVLERSVLPPESVWELAGQEREVRRSTSSLWMALGLAIFLVYVIMASTFESLRDPLVIMFSVPLALVGVSGGLWFTGSAVNAMVFLGMIVLAGVVVANAIVLVDAIGRLREEGLGLDEALRAASAERLRPILITALNSVLGLAPLALGFGEGQEIQRPLAITVIFGLASSTFLTLVVVPLVYATFARWRPNVDAGGV